MRWGSESIHQNIIKCNDILMNTAYWMLDVGWWVVESWGFISTEFVLKLIKFKRAYEDHALSISWAANLEMEAIL